MAEPQYVTEALTAINTAPDYPALHQVFAERVTTLVLDHGNLTEVRALARAWRARHQQLLAADLNGGGDV